MDITASNNVDVAILVSGESTWIRRLMATLRRLVNNAWFAYACIILLQLKVVWNIWQFRDITTGDTPGYFANAFNWFQHLQNSFGWSPIYTAFYGLLLHIAPDAYTTTLLHRLIIVFTASVLVLTLMRRLLPPAIALLVSAWWVILPINFDTLYEVHLFAVLPTLLIFIIATRRPSSWMRGAVLGLLIVGAVLVRNELSIALALWVVICLVGELSERRSRKKSLRLYSVAYGLPSLLALGIIAFFYAHSSEQGTVLQAEFEGKHTLNVCQIYAFNYQQRSTDWHLSPWTQCQDLMKRDFGVPQPSMIEAIRLNPGAMAAYFLWNLRLVPAGLQKLMFNSTMDNVNPDYTPTHMGDPIAGVLTLGFLVVVFWGGWYLWRERHYWWQTWFKDRYMGWVAMLWCAVTVGVVMLMERSRPSYMFNLSILLLSAFGMALYAIVHRAKRLEWLSAATPLVISAGIIFIPPYYTATYDNIFGYQGRPVMTVYHQLEPFATVFEGQTVAIDTDPIALCSYLIGGGCTGSSYQEIMKDKPSDIPVSLWLEQKGIGLLYMDEANMNDPLLKAFINTLDPTRWQVIVNYNASDGQWMLIRHIKS